MSKDTCNLCTRQDINSGKDTLLYEDDFCFIVKNGNSHLKENGKLRYAKKRMSLVINEHKPMLTEAEQARANSTLKSFMSDGLGLKFGEDYFIKPTMGTYPSRYHVHVY